MYNDLMLAPSGLSKLEREMIAVVVSRRTTAATTASSRMARPCAQLSGDPKLGEQMVMNYRAAHLSKRQRAMLDFAVKLTRSPGRSRTRIASTAPAPASRDRDIWDIATVAGFYNMSNRVASRDRYAAERRLSRAQAR